MTSAIIATDPVATVPTTQSVRDNFAVAKSEISALQLATTTTAAITGGTIDGAVIGGSTPAAGDFTTLGATGTITGPSGTWDSGGIDIATTDTYAIAGTNVFDNETTLTATVVNSSLTSVGTLASITIGGEIVETVYAIPASTTPAIDPVNGTIQTWTLTGVSTPTFSIATGESVKLTIAGHASHTVSWVNVTAWIDGTEPTVHATNPAHIELWAEGATIYGSFIGHSS